MGRNIEIVIYSDQFLSCRLTKTVLTRFKTKKNLKSLKKMSQKRVPEKVPETETEQIFKELTRQYSQKRRRQRFDSALFLEASDQNGNATLQVEQLEVEVSSRSSDESDSGRSPSHSTKSHSGLQRGSTFNRQSYRDATLRRQRNVADDPVTGAGRTDTGIPASDKPKQLQNEVKNGEKALQKRGSFNWFKSKLKPKNKSSKQSKKSAEQSDINQN